MPFLVKPIDHAIIPRVSLPGGDLSVAFYFMTRNTIIRRIKPIPMHPCFICINAIAITDTVIYTFNVSIIKLAKTILMWLRNA